MSKLYRARSLLYRRQTLQENIRWKALDEIYKIYMLLHRSDLKYLRKIVSNFFTFSAKNSKEVLQIAIFQHFSSNFGQILMKFDLNFAGYFQFPCFHFHITLFKQILKPNILEKFHVENF